MTTPKPLAQPPTSSSLTVLVPKSIFVFPIDLVTRGRLTAMPIEETSSRRSRRSFLQLSTAAAAAKVGMRIVTEPVLARAYSQPYPKDAVMIDANENRCRLWHAVVVQFQFPQDHANKKAIPVRGGLLLTTTVF